ncbi:MAG: preprotein translocase subunit YajC, partial [Acidobacteria bacterium]|nr:preprotein translocase subunit YajC [Acidobacteriota bacterium]
MIVNLAPILVVILIFYFLVIAPANRQRKQTQAMLAALKKGDKVVTSGGIYGQVQGVEDDVVYLRIADNVKIKLSRSAVAAVEDGRPEEAVAAFRRCVYADPLWVLGHFVLAQTLLRLGERRRAAGALRNVERLLNGVPSDQEVAEGDGLTVGRLRDLTAM